MDSFRSSRDSNGLTLVEMLVALAIIGVAAVIAVPSFSAWLESLTVRKATRQMVTDLQFAKMKAISDGVQYRVKFDSLGAGYTLEKGNSSSGSETWTQVEVSRNLRDKTSPYYAKAVTLNHNYPNDCIIFSPEGTSGMGTIKVSAGSCANGSVVCQASPKKRCERCVRTILTGRVAIAE